jgi:hypothetical protein
MNVHEKSDRALVPMNRPNKEEQASTDVWRITAKKRIFVPYGVNG